MIRNHSRSLGNGNSREMVVCVIAVIGYALLCGMLFLK